MGKVWSWLTMHRFATKQRRRALLLHHAGTDVQDIFSTLADTGGPTDYEQAVTALNAYFVPQVNTAFARQTFYQLKQKEGQTVQQFVTCLRQAAKDCDFGADKDNQYGMLFWADAILNMCVESCWKRHWFDACSHPRNCSAVWTCWTADGSVARLFRLWDKRDGEPCVQKRSERSEKTYTIQ